MDICNTSFKIKMDTITEEAEQKLNNNIKAIELFQLCDKENKGYITVTDLKIIIEDIGLNEQQIEDAFIQLDLDKDGFISAEEFETGFEKFVQEVSSSPEVDYVTNLDVTDQTELETEIPVALNDDSNSTTKRLPLLHLKSQESWSQSLDEFQLPKNSDLAGFLQDNLALQLWTQMQSQYTEILPVFEEFLQNLAVEHRRIREETSNLHNSFNRKSQAYEQQIKVLYDEMEGQIQLEKERLLTKKSELESQLTIELGTLNEEKDKDIQELVEKLLQATTQLELASLDKVSTEHENHQLLQEQELLKTQLDDYQQELEVLRIQLEKAKSDSINDKSKRFRSALQLSEKMAWERETLVKQLNLLRSINRRLQDEKDEIANSILKETESIENIFMLTSGDIYHPRLMRPERGSVVSDYFPAFNPSSPTVSNPGEQNDFELNPSSMPLPDGIPKLSLTNPFLIDCIESNFEDNFVDFENNENQTPSADIQIQAHLADNKKANPFLKMMNDIVIGADRDQSVASTYQNYSDPELDALHSFLEDGQVLKSVTHDEEKTPALCLVHPNNHQQNDLSDSTNKLESVVLNGKIEVDNLPTPTLPPTTNNNNNLPMPIEKPINSHDEANRTIDANKIISANRNASVQQTVFKVIFIGDSGVGKTSLINRICGGYFSDKFCTTIGVDFRVKTVFVDGHQVVLQLWDTAGQERFRSITSQYMRRSDGVLVTYDVNSEQSFRNVAGWLATMESVNTDNVIVGVVGNKIDLCSQHHGKAVPTSDGMLAAADVDALFFETSAKDYFGIEDMIYTIARKLKNKQVEDMESCARLTSGTDLLKVPIKKNSCC